MTIFKDTNDVISAMLEHNFSIAEAIKGNPFKYNDRHYLMDSAGAVYDITNRLDGNVILITYGEVCKEIVSKGQLEDFARLIDNSAVITDGHYYSTYLNDYMVVKIQDKGASL